MCNDSTSHACSLMPPPLNKRWNWSKTNKTPRCAELKLRITLTVPWSRHLSTRTSKSPRYSQSLTKAFSRCLGNSPALIKEMHIDWNFFRNPVIGYKWSRKPLSRVATDNLSFQQLYSELEVALQLENEARLIFLRDKATKSLIEPLDSAVGVNFLGQGRNGRPSKTHFKSLSHKKNHYRLRLASIIRTPPKLWNTVQSL